MDNARIQSLFQYSRVYCLLYSIQRLYLNIKYNQLYQQDLKGITERESQSIQPINIKVRQMKTKKDEGNDFFKKQKYEQAINCYNQYVKVNHPDNSKAYSNMALSYFRLKKYADCIRACESAVQIEPEFQKAFYRMYQAYRELKDNYGMLISAQRFCKLSKEEKDIKSIQKDIKNIKEHLCYIKSKDNPNSQTDKIILQIVNQFGETQGNPNVKKEPQICLQSKWQKIEQLAKENRRLALNQARKFINQECKIQQEKDKYKKLMSKFNNPVHNQLVTKSQETSEQGESSEQQPKLQELQKYTAEQQLKSNQKPASQIPNQTKNPSQKINTQISSQSIGQQLNSAQVQAPGQVQAKKQSVKNVQVQVSWEDFIKEEEAQRLFEIHVKNRLSKYEDQFVGLYETLSSLVRCNELDRIQKEAILCVTPKKLKKFNMLIKSYTGKERQQLAQLFAQNNLYKVMQNYYFKK